MAKFKYTYDQVKQEFDERGYDLISTEYHKVDEKLDYICRKHRDKGIQKISFSKFHSSHHGCYYCGRERTENAHKIEIDKESDKTLCESRNFTYIDSRKENGIFVIDFICNNHIELGVQTMRRNNMKREIKGCKYCSGKVLPEWYVLQRKDEICPQIELLEPYKNLTSPLNCICTRHDNKIHTTMQNILNGHACYYCGLEKLSKQNFLTEDVIVNNIHERNPHVSLVSYNGAGKISTWYCNKHNKEFQRCYSTLVYCDSGCDECYKELIRNRSGMTKTEFGKKLHKVHPEVDVLGEYVNNSTPIEMYCNKHNFKFSLSPSGILTRINCCPKSRITYKEESVCELLEKWGYKVTRQKTFDGCKDINLLPFDCYLDDFNIIIEYDGEQHFYPVKFGEQSYEDMMKKYEYTKHHDEIKTNFCKSKNIPLIRIPYYEYENLEYYLFDQLSKLGVIQETTKTA